MHTRSSNLYRSRRIPAHTMQIHASMVVFADLLRRYGDRADRRRMRIIEALEHLERVMHAGTVTG